MDEESWFEVTGFDGLLERTASGKFRSYKAIGSPIKGVPRARLTTPHLLTQVPTKRGYLRCHFWHKGKCHTFPVAHTVLELSGRPRPSKAMFACHFPDPNPANNDPSNLRWDTPEGNSRDERLLGRTLRGERNPSHKLTEEKAMSIIARLKADGRRCNELYESVGAEFGVCRSTVSHISNGRTWKHLPR